MMVDLQDLPAAVANLLCRMFADPSQRLTYEMTGDGCSTGLSLTWTSVSCSGCQGARCPSRHHQPPRRPRPRSWAMGDGFCYSSPEEDGEDPYNFNPEADCGLENRITLLRNGDHCIIEEEEDEEGEDSEEWSGPGVRPHKRPEHSSIPVIRVTQADMHNDLLDTTYGGGASSCSPDPDISEEEEEEEELLEGSGSEFNSKCSECMDSGLCLDNPGSSCFSSQAHGGGGYVTTTSSSTSSASVPRREHQSHNNRCHEQLTVTCVDQGVQTVDPLRPVKRCHAVWAALEQLYVYYDDKEQLLRLSEVDGEQKVMKTKRTEATLRTLPDKDGLTSRVVLEMLWIAMGNEC